MLFNQEIDYAYRAMIILATQNEQCLSAKVISKQFRIPNNFLAIILPRLVKAGLIRSIQGPKGGYQLAKPADEISFLDIYESLSGPLEILACQDSDGCDLLGYCSMVDVWKNLKAKFDEYLASVKLSQVMMSPLSLQQIQES